VLGLGDLVYFYVRHPAWVALRATGMGVLALLRVLGRLFGRGLSSSRKLLRDIGLIWIGAAITWSLSPLAAHPRHPKWHSSVVIVVLVLAGISALFSLGSYVGERLTEKDISNRQLLKAFQEELGDVKASISSFQGMGYATETAGVTGPAGPPVGPTNVFQATGSFHGEFTATGAGGVVTVVPAQDDEESGTPDVTP